MSENKLSLLDNNGITVAGESHLAKSGFRYGSGVRDFGSLKIVEEFAQGTGVTFLCGIKVFDKEGTLIADKKMDRSFYYEREKVKKVVLHEILNTLIDANKENINFELDAARMKINALLNKAYFETSYNAINNWALELGIIEG